MAHLYILLTTGKFVPEQNNSVSFLLSFSFRAEGIAVDVHVHRISNMLGWANSSQPEGTRKVWPSTLLFLLLCSISAGS